MHPHAGVAVCLQFKTHCITLLTGLLAAMFGKDAAKMLDVMAPFMSDHILLSQRCVGSTELRFHLLEETQVQVH